MHIRILGLVTNRPRLSWPADPTALYTVMLVDSEIECILPQQYIFWMVTNIPGSNVDLGTEVMDYVPPFSAELEDGKCQLDSTDGTIKLGAPGHTMLLMVYQQQGKVYSEVATSLFHYNNLNFRSQWMRQGEAAAPSF